MHILYWKLSADRKVELKNFEMSEQYPYFLILNFLKLLLKSGLVNPVGSSWFRLTPFLLGLDAFKAQRALVDRLDLYAGANEM